MSGMISDIALEVVCCAPAVFLGHADARSGLIFGL